ncbi:nuclear transport factor 2 family protein [Mycolicibacterium sediminis]|uniref:Steroid Delta-isomerase n=1 Tax=Mycolicibacterium sediminis TaxID=1286180 RepID=A0A7I7QUR8_9MYCO|nr:ketosteroid isomerase family protein [Mycolicibacterium sediminis]BBY30051.1 steroid Delta-isomerase [Mycolicibacterium sediminis]
MPHHAAADPEDVLAAVERSPAAAGAHDRSGWVGLFARTGSVEDPVGSRPHRGHAEIGRFYDTFIGPRDIVFHRDLDVVDGLTVVRALDLEVTMSSSISMTIPAYLRYDLVGGDLAVDRLRAHWELPAMVLEFARGGPAALPVGLALTRSLLANQGLAGAAGFAGGFRRVGARGRRTVTEFLDDVCAGDEVAVRRRVPDAGSVTLGDATRIGTSGLVARLRGGRWSRPIVAGRWVAATVEADGRRGVLFVEVGTRPATITSVRLFVPAG